MTTIDNIMSLALNYRLAGSASRDEHAEALRAALTEALAAQPAREPLTDKQVSLLWSDAHNDTTDRMAFQVFARLIEHVHGIGGEK